MGLLLSRRRRRCVVLQSDQQIFRRVEGKDAVATAGGRAAGGLAVEVVGAAPEYL